MFCFGERGALGGVVRVYLSPFRVKMPQFRPFFTLFKILSLFLCSLGLLKRNENVHVIAKPLIF